METVVLGSGPLRPAHVDGGQEDFPPCLVAGHS